MRLHRLLKMNWHGTEHRYHMVQKCIRIFLAGMLFFCTAAVSQLAAIPGIDSCLPDIPGAYVYYRDYSFPDTVYIGFLQYDETSYCMRLYSDSLRGSSAPYALEIYFTLGEKDDRTEMTGERIMGSFSPDETDLVNYLHDLVYEFSARRGNISAQTFASSIAESFQSDTQATLKTHFISVQEEYPQFGGTVDMNYAFYIPVFNLHSITAPNGDIRFELITAAALSHSSDTSFFDFTGIPLSISDKERDFTPADNPEILEIKDTAQTLRLDDQWKLAGPGVWMLGNAAVLSYSSAAGETLPAAPVEKNFLPAHILRNMLLGMQGAYPDFRTVSIQAAKDSFTIESSYYLPAEKSVSHSFKKFNLTANDTICLFDLTVFDSIYKTNRQYFNTVVSNYQCK